jgi:hypothetical protein
VICSTGAKIPSMSSHSQATDTSGCGDGHGLSPEEKQP